MGKEQATGDKKSVKRPRPKVEGQVKRAPTGLGPDAAGVLNLQRKIGNRAVGRLLAPRAGAGLAQRSGGKGAFELDDATAGRINRARGGGQPLDSAVQARMSQATGYDMSGVRVHHSPESDALNRQLEARAFTSGQDVFFRQGAYDPGSSGGQELIAHELTHVVQQGTGAVRGGDSGRMTVNAPGDAHERQADAVSKSLAGPTAQVQRQVEEEEVQAKSLQRQEEEEEVQAKALQRQEEEEEVQAKFVQRQEEEEEVQAKFIQRQDIPEEEPVPA
jgi:hypothetical protein